MTTTTAAAAAKTTVTTTTPCSSNSGIINNSSKSSNSSSIRASSRKNRVYVFREFVMDTYGDYLTTGDVILDVAGGKGDLSWLLTHVDDMKPIVIDPRVTNNHLEKSVRYLREHPDEAQIRSIPNRPTHQPLATLLPKLKGKSLPFYPPQHLRILLDIDFLSALENVLKTNNYHNDDDYHQQQQEQQAQSNSSIHGSHRTVEGWELQEWEQYWEKAIQKARRLCQEQGIGGGFCSPTSTGIINKNEIQTALKALETILATKLILGFHPDQATEACIDLASLLRVPFCIVPCCVFPSEFPHRIQNDTGKFVKYYDDFIPYLLQKNIHPPSSSICTIPLKFHETATARNLALYTTRDTMDDRRKPKNDSEK